MVELTTAILSAAVAWHFGFGFTAGCALLVTWMLIPLTGIDADHQLLPDAITLPLLWLGLLASLGHDPAAGSALPVTPGDAILGAAAGYLLLWSVFHAFKLLTGKEGMGFGDFKLFAALGAWLGWQMLPLILLLSARRRRDGRHRPDRVSQAGPGGPHSLRALPRRRRLDRDDVGAADRRRLPVLRRAPLRRPWPSPFESG